MWLKDSRRSQIARKAIISGSPQVGIARVARPYLLFCGLAILFVVVLCASSAFANDQAKQLLSLVDYIGGDYKNAVKDGKVADQDEYQEMSEFAVRSLELFSQLKAGHGRDIAGIEEDLRRLAAQVQNKSGEQLVPDLAQRIKERLIAAYDIITYPKAIPDFTTGKTSYLQNCSQCHGATGRGDGPGAATMQPKEPKPANFLDADRMSGLSPFKAFNTMSFGIQGTAMPNFSALSEEERWQAAFYVHSLRFTEADAVAGKFLFDNAKVPAEIHSARTLANLADGELTDKLSAFFPSGRDTEKVLAYLRRGLLETRKDPLATARTYLKEALDLYETGNQKDAYQKSLEAYLDGYELAEPALYAKDPAIGKELESRFSEFRGSIRSGADLSRIRDLYTQLDAGLAQASTILGSGSSESGAYTFFSATVIIIREGLEAALIVSAIIAVMKATGAVRSIRYVHFGWGLALLSGVLTWALAQTVLTISGAQREIVEGLTSLLAAMVLFSVSYWLISKAEAKKWQRYIHAKVQEAMSGGRLFAVAGVSFLAVYREAFETVLFYQALWIQSQDNRALVIWGFLAGVFFVAAVVSIIFKLGLRIPLRLFFGVSSALLYVLAFVFAGEGIKDLQSAGWFSETRLPNIPEFPILGIYPTAETLLVQGILILALIGALLWVLRQGPAQETLIKS